MMPNGSNQCLVCKQFWIGQHVCGFPQVNPFGPYGVPYTPLYQPTGFQKGWQCPICFAVMAPIQLSCINCVGSK